jgi:sortase (surface protein transpeptidase)
MALSNISVRNIFLGLIMAAIIVLSVFLTCAFFLLLQNKLPEVSSVISLPAATDQEQPGMSRSENIIAANPGLPIELRIPKIGVKAKIQHVGKTTDGKRMAVPKGYRDVGWYRLGARPGNAGNAVMAGHLDNSLGLAAVFVDLSLLAAGDEIEVTDDKGTILTFVVSSKEIYSVANAPIQKIFGSTAEAHLNLITCDGVWLKDQKMYDRRLVIYSTLVSVRTPLTESP